MTTPTPPALTSASEGRAPQHSPRRATLAAFSGAFIEWYAFYLYGTAAAIVFPRVFFPDADPTISVIQSFGTFATGFLLRPAGAILFGHFGDKVGRKPMLILTILLMGISTFLIGFLPGYETIGIWAVILLITLRLMDGLAIGGEFGGGALLALENAPKNRRGLLGSFHQMGTPVGLLASTGVLALVQLLPEDQFFDWGGASPSSSAECSPSRPSSSAEASRRHPPSRRRSRRTLPTNCPCSPWSATRGGTFCSAWAPAWQTR